MSYLEQLKEFLQPSIKMPVLFVGHGSPMNGIEENEFVRGFREVAKKITQPQAIICISAHWFTRGTLVTAMAQPRTIHDFYGFPRELYDQQYPAPGYPELAAAAVDMLAPTPAIADHNWGYDHGTWTILKHMYPGANIPVIQLSIDYTKPPAYHFELGSRLASLRDYGVLIMGSGNIVHNLGLVDFTNINTVDYGFDWAVEAREKFNGFILDENNPGLFEYNKLGEAGRLAVPTPDHYLPLMYTLGLRSRGENTTLFNDKLLAGSLSMTSLLIGEEDGR